MKFLDCLAMKSYPSIKQSRKEFEAIIFDKLDGSNLRISWDRQTGWYEFATRTRVIKTNHKLFGRGYKHFLETYADELVIIANNQGWFRFDAFFEFYGDKSFAGRHDLSEMHKVTLIDLAPNTKNRLLPQPFLDLFGHLPLPACLGCATWNEEFVEAVRCGLVEGVSFEGVVAKAVSKQRMAKAKTQAWMDRVIAEFGEKEGNELINS